MMKRFQSVTNRGKFSNEYRTRNYGNQSQTPVVKESVVLELLKVSAPRTFYKRQDSQLQKIKLRDVCEGKEYVWRRLRVRTRHPRATAQSKRISCSGTTRRAVPVFNHDVGCSTTKGRASRVATAEQKAKGIPGVAPSH